MLGMIAAGVGLLKELPEIWDGVAGIFGCETPETVQKAGALAKSVSNLLAKGEVTPEQEAKLQGLLLAHKERIEELKIRELEIEAANTKDARAREIALAKAGHGGAWVTAVVALVVTLGFFGMLYLVLRHESQAELGQAPVLLLGSLATAFGAVVNYYLGSSLGSTRKDGMVGKGGV